MFSIGIDGTVFSIITAPGDSRGGGVGVGDVEVVRVVGGIIQCFYCIKKNIVLFTVKQYDFFLI